MKYWEKPFGKQKPKAVDGEIHILDDRMVFANPYALILQFL